MVSSWPAPTYLRQLDFVQELEEDVDVCRVAKVAHRVLQAFGREGFVKCVQGEYSYGRLTL